MPLVGFKRQAAPGTCPSGYQFYACNTAQVVWAGCCAVEPCTTGCPSDAQLDDDDEEDDAATSTQSSTASTTLATVISGSGGPLSRVVVALVSSDVPSVAETASSASPTSTALGEQSVPSDVTEDPATQTIMGYGPARKDGTDPTPHTEKGDVPAIIGATLGAAGIVILISLLFFCYRRRNRRREQRRRTMGPYKRDPNGEDHVGDAKHASTGGGSTRSRPRAHNSIIHDTTSYHGSSHEMRSVDGASTNDPPLKPLPNAYATPKPPAYQNLSPHELDDTAISPARNDSAAYPDQTIQASHAGTASLSDGDPSSSSRYSARQYRGQNSQAGSRTPSKSPSRSSAIIQPVGDTSQQHNAGKDDPYNPYTGEIRMSRSTGSTFTPANGAPTIKISAA